MVGNDDDRIVDVDQVVGRTGKDASPRRAAVHRVVGSADAMNFGVTSLSAPNIASSSTARYSSTARPAAFGGRPAVPSMRVRSPALAWIKLASTAKPSPPTRPSQMQRCRTVSNRHRQPIAFAEAATAVLRKGQVVGQPRAGRTSGRRGPDEALRTPAARSGYPYNTPPSTSGSSVQDRSKAVPPRCRTAPGRSSGHQVRQTSRSIAAGASPALPFE
jgi:hypothetical protein